MTELIRRPVYSRNDYIDMDRRYGQAANRRTRPIMTRRRKYMSDPTVVSSSIEKRMRQHIPEETNYKPNKFVTKIDAIEANIPKSDPRQGMATEIRKDFDRYINDPRFANTDPEALLDTLYKGHLDKRRESIHKYSWSNRNSPFRFLPGASNPIRELDDQTEWDAAKPRDEYNSVVANFLLGAGASAAIGGIKMAATRALPSALLRGIGVAAVAPFPGSRAIAVAGVLAIPGFLAYEYVANKIKATPWAQENPKKALAAEFILGGATAVGVESVASKFGKKLLDKGAQAIMRRVSGEQAMRANPTGENILTFANAKGEEVTQLNMLGTKIQKATDGIIKTVYNKNYGRQAANELLRPTPGLTQRTLTRDIPITGTGQSVPIKQLLQSNQLATYKKYSKKQTKYFGKYIDQIENGVAKNLDDAAFKVNTGEAISKEIGKDFNFTKAVAEGQTKSMSERKVAVEVYKAHGRIYQPIKTPAMVKADTKAAKVVDKAISKTIQEFKFNVGDKVIGNQTGKSTVILKRTDKGYTFKDNKGKSHTVSANLFEQKFSPEKKSVAQIKAEQTAQPVTAEQMKGWIKETAPTTETQTTIREAQESLTRYNEGLAPPPPAKVTEMSNIDVVADIPEAGSKKFEAWFRARSPQERQMILNDVPIAVKAKQKAQTIQRAMTKEKRIRDEKLLAEDGPTTIAEEITVDPKAFYEQATLAEKEMIDAKNLKDLMDKNLTPAEKLHKEFQALNKANLAKILTGLGLVTTIINLLSPSEAEANPAVARIGQKAITTILSSVKGGATETLVKSLENQRLWIKPIQEGQTVLGEYMRGITIKPSLSSISTVKEFPKILSHLVTPYTEAAHYFGRNAVGAETFTNPIVQWASQRTASIVNTEQGIKIFENILREAGIGSSRVPTERAFAELEKTHVPQVVKRGFHLWSKRRGEVLSKRIESRLERSVKDQSKHPKNPTRDKRIVDDRAALEVLNEGTLLHKTEVELLENHYKDYVSKYDAIIKPLAQEHPSVRLFLAAEDTAEFEMYPWLKGMINENEVKAASMLKLMNEDYAGRMVAMGQKVIKERPFMHHAAHPERRYKVIEDLVRESTDTQMSMTPPMARFFSRSSGMRPMMPEATYTMNKYIPDVNLRLASIEFWKGPTGKGPDGWDAFARSDVIQSNQGMANFFERFKNGFKPQDRTAINKVAEVMYGMEVARLLAFSASVPFKHSLKLVGDFRVFGMEGVKIIPESSKTFFRSLGRKIGIKSEKGVYDDAVEAMTNTGGFVRTMADLDIANAPNSVWEYALQTFNRYGGAPTAAVEKFDRGTSTIAAMRMAEKQGMSAEQATYAIYDTIIKTNFLSGTLNPGWLRDPKIRFFFMFQGTPYKIMEQRVALSMRAYKGVKKGGQELLKQLRQDVKEGEHRLKWNLIKDALESEKDIFGTPLVRQFMRQILAMGVVLGTAKYAFDADLMNHIFHPPFIKTEKKGIKLAFSPITNAAYKTWMRDEENDEDFWFSNFFKEWWGRGGPYPNTLKKALRLNNNDIPAIYRGNTFKYILAVPSIKAKKDR